MVLLVSSIEISVVPVIYSNCFGNKDFSLIQGFSLMVGGLCSSTTGIIGGAVKDATGSYSGAYLLYGTLSIAIAMLAIICIGIPCRKKYRESKNLK